MEGIVGRRVLVTGAAAGIGRAIALAFGKAGARVCIDDHGKIESGRAVAELIRAAGGEAFSVEADVSSPEQLAHLADEVERRFGGLDVLVNNAAVVLVRPFRETSLEEWRRVLDVNLTGPFLTCRAMLPLLERSAAGCIVNIASELAYLGRDRYTAYTASKGGLVSFTRSLARELAPRIRVNAIAPGPTDTDMLASELTTPELREAEVRIPLGRLASPDEIAGTALFLASSQASFYCGEVLSPNGGALMR